MRTVYYPQVIIHPRRAQSGTALSRRTLCGAAFYKPVHARKAQPGAWYRLAAVALCCLALVCGFRLYGRAQPV